MSKLNERITSIDQLIESAQDSGAAGALIVCGDDATESGDLRVTALTEDASAVAMAYTRLSYIIASEMAITSSKVVSRDADRCVKSFALANGVELTLTVTSPDKFDKSGWYRIVWDDMGIASQLSASVPEDILCDLAEPAAEPAAEDDMADDFDDLPEDDTVIVPVVTEQKEEPAEEQPAEEQPAQDPDSELEQYLEFVSRNLRNAQRAIASGQLIRAGEIVSVLRKMAIELICVRSGIESNFEQSIDFIDCEEKRMLTKTYPKAMDQQNLVLALGTLSELFDRLI